MKYVEILGGIPLMISNEENALVTKIQECGKINKKSLDEREQEIARKLVSRGAISRNKINDVIYYCVNDLENVERD